MQTRNRKTELSASVKGLNNSYFTFMALLPHEDLFYLICSLSDCLVAKLLQTHSYSNKYKYIYKLNIMIIIYK